MIYVGMNPILVSDLFIKQFFIIGNIFYKLQACNSFESYFIANVQFIQRRIKVLLSMSE